MRLFVPCGHGGLFFYLVWAAYAAKMRLPANRRLHNGRLGKGKGLSFGMRLFVPCGHGGLFFYLVWAAYAARGKAGPVMGLRPLLGPPCIPPEAPPFRFSITICLRGLRVFCSGSFLAALGDLPARRATPSFAFALTKSSGASAA